MKKLISALLAAAAALLLLCCCRASEQPLRVSVYLTEESRIVTLPYRDYIAGCVLGCVPSDCGVEALKAIACAINSRALCVMANPKPAEYCGADFSDSADPCLPYVTEEAARLLHGAQYDILCEKVARAVDFGAERALYFGGGIIPAQLCRCSAGITDSGDEAFPYISAEIPEDEAAADFISTRAFSTDYVMRTLTERLSLTALPADCGKWFSGAHYLPSGTLEYISFGGIRLSGAQLMQALGLRSAAITVEYTEQRFLFTVKGSGCNMGLSINAAAVMAQRGCSCEEILSRFYAGAELRQSRRPISQLREM